MKLTQPQRHLLQHIHETDRCRFQITIMNNPTFRRLVKKRCLVKSKEYSKICIGKLVRYDLTVIGRQAIGDHS